jgi:hypothetical protein
MYVHTQKRNRLLHDRMRDLVYIKFNSKLKQKKDNKDKDPLEVHMVDALEDEDNESITGIEPTEDQDQEGEAGATSQSQEIAAASQREETRRGGQRNKKRKRLIHIPTAVDDEDISVASSDGEDDNDMPSPSCPSSDSEAHSDEGPYSVVSVAELMSSTFVDLVRSFDSSSTISLLHLLVVMLCQVQQIQTFSC